LSHSHHLFERVFGELLNEAIVDSATLAKNWGVEIEAANMTHLVTTQRGIIWMIHPSLNLRLPVTMFTDTMYSTILSRKQNKAAQISCTYF
jgi:hypothetical protein